MKQLTIINPEHISDDEVQTFTLREASRAVVVDENNMIALLHVSKEHYYKLPGGGIEKSENPKIALQRECLEEIGTKVEVIEEIGSIVEYKKIFSQKQISYCYFARVRGEKKASTFTEEEMLDGFEQVWLPYDEALQKLSHSSTSSFEGSAYIIPRDTTFLTAAKTHLGILN